MANGSAMISFHNFSYWYPDTSEPALSGVTLDIPAGALTLVAGPSGSGKSTLLRTLNGLVPHFTGGHVSGRLRVDGHDPIAEGTPGMAPLVGFVFQDPEAEFVTGQVEDEIAFALENAAVPRAEMRARVEAIMARLGLTRLRDRAISTLSGGEMQRVAIASALVLRPRVLVLDEPTSQLDPDGAEEVLAALTTLRETLGLTIVLAEHRLERVLPFAERLLIVEGGRARIGPPAEMLAAGGAIAPPLARLSRVMGWPRVPLTIEDARALARGSATPRPPPRTVAIGDTRLEIADLAAGYDDGAGRIAAVEGVSLTVRAGEIVAVMGHNGAGKSSLLKCVVGLLPAARGEIRVGGVSTTGKATWEICRDVAYLSQNPNLMLFAETVALELRETLRNHGVTGAAADAPVTALLERLGLTRYAGAYPRDLSAGERQRVAFGAVTVTEPGVLLLDEPTRGLDAQTKHGLAGLLRQWRERAAIVVVTHDVEFAAELADRVVVMESGRVVADGPPAEVMLAFPAFTPQVARVFPGCLTAEEVEVGLAPTPSAPPTPATTPPTWGR